MLKGTCGAHVVQPLLKQVHLQLAVQNHIQAGFEYLQRETPQPLCATCSSALPPSQKIRFFPHIQMEPPVFHFVLTCPPELPGPSLQNKGDLQIEDSHQ